MKVTVVKGSERYVEECKRALMDSKLGSVYFNTEEKALASVRRCLERGQLYVALTESGEFAGYEWIIPNGAFHSFPYLHIIAVKKELRSQGVGKALLDFYADSSSEYANKAFLIVDDFNPDAQRLYEREGYIKVGVIPDIYIKGIDGCLMMKPLEKKPSAR